MEIEDPERKPQLQWRRRDVTAWNKWRELHPKVAIDLLRLDVFRFGLFKAYLLKTAFAVLSKFGLDRGDLFRENFKGADLSGADLRRADLRRADLSEANLSKSYLNESDLYLANLNGANLNGANLSGAALYDAKFSEADLRQANLSRAALRGANFSRANLYKIDLSRGGLSRIGDSEIDLSGIILREANLREADLSGIILSGIDLRGADLRGADLRGATLRSVNLHGADLSGARTLKTIFDDVDLRAVKGLETIQHEGPSVISTSTLERSEGDIPNVFLSRAGLSEIFITYVRSLTQHSIQYYTCFISCSSKDRSFAERLNADLRSKGVHSWYAPEDLKIGDHYHQRIDESIRLYDKLILVLSEHAVQSAWVEREVVAAREKEDREQRPVLFPLRLDDAVMSTTKAWAADVRRRWHIGDFTKWRSHDDYQQAFDRLLRDLKAEGS